MTGAAGLGAGSCATTTRGGDFTIEARAGIGSCGAEEVEDTEGESLVETVEVKEKEDEEDEVVSTVVEEDELASLLDCANC